MSLVAEVMNERLLHTIYSIWHNDTRSEGFKIGIKCQEPRFAAMQPKIIARPETDEHSKPGRPIYGGENGSSA